MVLYWDLVKIAFGFAVVKNSCEGIKTIFSVGLWSCSLGVKYEGIIGVILTLFLSKPSDEFLQESFGYFQL